MDSNGGLIFQGINLKYKKTFFKNEMTKRSYVLAQNEKRNQNLDFCYNFFQNLRKLNLKLK